MRSYFRSVRYWLGDHLGIVLVLLVSVYLLGFFLYHTYVAVDTQVWQGTARYQVGDACELLMEYPTRVPLETSEPADYPITLWMWYAPSPPEVASRASVSCAASPASTVPISYYASLGPLGRGLEFVDESGSLVPATLSLDLALSESTAAPARLYIRRAPSAGLGPIPLELEVWGADASGGLALLPSVPEPGADPTVVPESERASRWRHFLAVLFTPGPLQWLFTAVAGIVGVWEVYRDLQNRREERRAQAAERRRLQQERIGALQDLEPPERAFRTYMSLHVEFQEDGTMRDELHNAYRPEWLPYLRQRLGRQLRAGNWDEARRSVEALDWEWRQATSDRTVDTLRAFVGHLEKPTKPPLRETLVEVLDAFRAVGLEATEPVVDWLTAVCPDPQDAKAVLFAGGGASGRYLLLQWGDRDEEVADLLRQWERQVLPPLHPEHGSSVLWARERGEPRAVWRGVRRLGLDFDPFGPQKAEQDPRLPDLFYRLPPIWDEVTARQPGIFIASPGSGRSALIWMIRYESELVGSDVEDVFPVFVPLYSLSSLEELAQVLQKAMATALASVAARNPYALLGLEDVEQQALIELMLRSAGGLSPLLQQLQAAGLSPDDPDGQLLQEALHVVARTQKTWEGVIEWDMPRFHPYGREHTFLLIDVSFDDPDKVCALLEALFDRWLPFLAPRQVVAKVFLSSEPSCCPVAPVWFRWDDGALQQLVQHRMTRAGLVVQEGQPLMDGWVEDLADPDALLIEKAEGCPKRLVGLGNRLIRRLAQPKPLSRDEFSELLS